ncbi:methionine biosynthesis protein MetW [candidate division KSB1 bacterium]|nr:methionine biosynthesis protein MetW [candidate division KSB1 bacterium]
MKMSGTKGCFDGVLRRDLRTVVALIEPKSRVLDLGCGDGGLLGVLNRERGISGHGIERSFEAIVRSIENGVSVIQADLDEGLGEYPNHSFDYVLLSHTLQTVHKPAVMMREMVRVGRLGIVTMPNFAHWRIRLQFVFRGRMPKTRLLPYSWYDTPNIHLVTLSDFCWFCRRHDIEILRQINLPSSRLGRLLADFWPNLFAESAVFVLQGKTE